MKKFFLCILCVILTASQSWAQDNPYHIYGEGNKNTVKLLWYVDSWPEKLEGFIIKRRVITTDKQSKWVELSKSVIYPEISTGKDLSNVVPDKETEQALKAKLASYLKKDKTQTITLTPFSKKEFLAQAKADATAVQNMRLAFSIDYDIAILAGFGAIDKNMPFDEVYEYGLFPVIGGKTAEDPAGTYQWKYGDKPNLSPANEITTRPTDKKTKIEVVWNVEMKQYKELNLNGFNVYRHAGSDKFVKLNSTPIWVSSTKEKADLNYYDNTAAEGVNYTYAVAPVNLFGTEGIRISTVFDPVKAYHNYVMPGLKEFKTMISPGVPPEVIVNWEFKKEEEAFMKGFRVERADKSNNFVPISDLLPVTSRSFSDIGKKNIMGYYSYRVIVVTDDPSFKGWSNVVLFVYNPVIKPPVPKNLTGKFSTEKGHQYISLVWEGKTSEDSLTAGYHIYANFPPSEKLMLEASIPLIKTNQYKYEVFNSIGAKYRFEVSAQSKFMYESDPCKFIEVFSPTKNMPYPNLWPIKVDSNRVVLEWRYDNIPDLKGFQVYQNKKLIVNEKTLTKDARKWVSPPMEYGKEYVFEIAAISDYGVISGMSFERKIRILKKTK